MDIDRLKHAAAAVKAHTRGEWCVAHANSTGGWGICVASELGHHDSQIVARMTGRDQQQKAAVADYIAACSPDAILTLLAEIERLRASAVA